MTPRPPRSTLFPTRRSSDLCPVEGLAVMRHQQCEADHLARRLCQRVAHGDEVALRLCHLAAADGQHRSEERRVGKECRSRSAPPDDKKKETTVRRSRIDWNY